VVVTVVVSIERVVVVGADPADAMTLGDGPIEGEGWATT
jgi:hypothetical protein